MNSENSSVDIVDVVRRVMPTAIEKAGTEELRRGLKRLEKVLRAAKANRVETENTRAGDEVLALMVAELSRRGWKR